MNVKIIKPSEKYIEQMVLLADEARQYHIDILNGYFKSDASSVERDVIRHSISQCDKSINFIAIDDADNVIGMIMGDVLYKPWLINSDIGHVGNFIVTAKARAQGIGKKLMDAFISECKQRNISEVTLGVYNKNINAYKFYNDYGFEPIVQKMSLKL